MIKLNPINRNVPGTKCCVHENGMTAVVSDTDSIYLYSGGKEKPLQMLNFNPKSGQVICISARGEKFLYSSRQLEQLPTKQIYDNGMQLLATAHYSPPQSEEDKIYEWLHHSLWNRSAIHRKELKSSHCLVARIWKDFTDTYRLHAECGMLGDCIPREVEDGWQMQRNSDPGKGIRFWEGNDHQIYLTPIKQGQKSGSGIVFSKVVKLTREEAEWLQGFLPLFPAQRFLFVHKEMTEAAEAVEAKRQERARAIKRGVSRAGGKTDPFSTVEI